MEEMTPSEAEAVCSVGGYSHLEFADKHLSSARTALLVDEFLEKGGYTLRKSNRDSVKNAMRRTIVQELNRAAKTCHICGKTDESIYRHQFGMVYVYAQRKNWARFFGIAGLGAITSLLFGFQLIPNLTKDKYGMVVKPFLNVCTSCAENRKGWFGGVVIRNEDYELHPLWNQYKAMGMSFIPPHQLADWK